MLPVDSFSPDGSSVAFRSERDGGGIYVIPAIGGEATLIAKGGRDPRFSPDGRWIAYWQTDSMVAPFVSGTGTVYIVATAGGPPRRLLSDLTEAGVPEWSEDSKRLIVFGRKDELPPPVAHWNWWTVPVGGGSATSTDAFALLLAKGFSGITRPGAPRVASWRRNELLFYAQRGDSTNVWKVDLDSSNSRVTRDPRQLTSGTGLNAYPSLIADDRLLFAGLTNSTDVWILPADTNRANTAGQPQRVTETIGPHQYASLSADGKLLAYSSLRYWRPRAWIKNLESGVATPLTSSATSQCITQLSSDGTLILYTTCDENGAYDMAGNVKEWVQNEAEGRRVILGGSFNEPGISFHDLDAQDPFLRLPTFGIRCAFYPTPVSAVALQPIASTDRDYSRERPVNNAIFEFIHRMYAYEKTPLLAKTESVDDSNEVWGRETVSYGAAYGGERIRAYLFLPKNVKPPYQTVLFVPARYAQFVRDSVTGARTDGFDFLMRTGRAVLYPDQRNS